MRFRSKANGFTSDHMEEFHHHRHRKQQEDEDSHNYYYSTSNNCYSSQEDDRTMLLFLTKTIASAITTTRYSHIIGSKRKSKTSTSLIRFLVLFMLLVASSLFLCILLSRHYYYYLFSMFTTYNHDDVIPVSAATARGIEQTVASPKDILLDVLNLYNKDRKQGQIGGEVDFGGRNAATGTTRATKTKIRTRAVGVASTTTSTGSATTTTLTGRYLYPCHDHEDTVQINNETQHSMFCNVEFPLLDLSDHDDWEEPSLRNPWDGGSLNGGNTGATSSTSSSSTSIINTTTTASNALHQKDRLFAHLTFQKDYAVLTKRGYKGGFMTSQVNQDRPFIFHHFLNSPMEEGHFVMGIMNGHGTFGHFVAQLVLMELIRELLVNQLIGLLAKEVQEKHIVDNHKWIELFQKIDQKLPKDLVDDGGCTASIVAKLSNDTIVVANTGDSETFIVGYQKKSVTMGESLSSASFNNTTATNTTTSLSSLLNVTILYKSKKHKAHSSRRNGKD
jgi:Serine/threonine protein phosphatase